MTTRIGPVVGREPELQRVRALVENVAKEGGALVIRGEPGIGKSAIVLEAERSANDAGMLVLKTAGVESEARLPFAGLHKLVHPILGGAQALPERQRDALLGAFGMVDSTPGSNFLIGLAALELLTDEASRRPVLVIAEDLHWLDSATLEVLAFVGRRLESDAVVLLASSRPTSEDPFQMAGLPDLSLEGLPPAAASELLDTHAPYLEQAMRTPPPRGGARQPTCAHRASCSVAGGPTRNAFRGLAAVDRESRRGVCCAGKGTATNYTPALACGGSQRQRKHYGDYSCHEQAHGPGRIGR